MPLYLSEERVQFARRGGAAFTRARGIEEAQPWSAIRLDRTGRAFLWLPFESHDPALTLLALDKDETAGAQTRNTLGNKLGLTLGMARTADILAEILLTSGRGWNALIPNSRGQREICLNGERWWSQRSIRGGAPTTDTFDGTDAGSPGSDWDNGPGASGNFRKTSGVAHPVNLAENACASYKASSRNFLDNHYAEITLTAGVAYPGVAVRGASSSNGTCYLVQVEDGNILRLYECTDTGSLDFDLLDEELFLTLGAGDVIRLSADGTTLTYAENGTQRGTTTDGSITTGQPGICGYDNSGSGVNITAWSADDIGGAPAGISIPVVYHHRQRN